MLGTFRVVSASSSTSRFAAMSVASNCARVGTTSAGPSSADLFSADLFSADLFSAEFSPVTISAPAPPGAPSSSAGTAPAATDDNSSDGAAATSPESNAGRNTISAVPTRTAVALSARPRTTLRPGYSISVEERLTGSSTNAFEAIDSTTDTAIATNRCVMVSGPHFASASTSAGQCQRYSE